MKAFSGSIACLTFFSYLTVCIQPVPAQAHPALLRKWRQAEAPAPMAVPLEPSAAPDPLLDRWEERVPPPLNQHGWPVPLEREVVERWPEFSPWLARHLQGGQYVKRASELLDHLLEQASTRSLLSEAILRSPADQWMWIVDHYLQRWDRARDERVIKRPLIQRFGELDQLLLQRLAQIGTAGEEAGSLLPRHLAIVQRWHKEWQRPHDPLGVGEDVAVAGLQSLAVVGTQPAAWREAVWPRRLRLNHLRLFERFVQAKSVSMYLASHVSPVHLELLREVSPQRQERFFAWLVPTWLVGSQALYNSRDNEYTELPRLAALWEAVLSSEPPTQRAFYAAIARQPVRRILDPLLELAADSPALRSWVLRFLVVQMNVKRWYLPEQEIPWVNLIYLMNHIDQPDDYLMMQEIARLCLKAHPGQIGIARTSELRPLALPTANPTSFGPDLDGFVRREVHHHQGPHIRDLVGLRLDWWRTGNATPLIHSLESLGTTEAQKTIEWLQAHPGKPDQLLNVLWNELASHLEVTKLQMSLQSLAIADDSVLEAVKRGVRQRLPKLAERPIRVPGPDGGWVEVPAIDRWVEREFRLYRILWDRYAVQTEQRALRALEEMREHYETQTWWPQEKLNAFLARYAAEEDLAALRALQDLRAAIRDHHLSAPGMAKWVSNRQFYEQDPHFIQEIHHGIPSYRGRDPNNSIFQLYVLGERLRPLELQLIGRLSHEVHVTREPARLRELMSELMRWVQAAGFRDQELVDLQEFIDSPTLTLGRLKFISKRLLEFMNRLLVKLDLQIGDLTDVMMDRLERDELHPDLLMSLGIEVVPSQFWRVNPRIRSHLQRQLVFISRSEFAMLRSVVVELHNLLDQMTDFQLMRFVQPPREGPTKREEVWISLDQAELPLYALERFGEKGRNLLRMSQQGLPVPPAVLFEIGAPPMEIMGHAQDAVRDVERQVAERGLADRLGALLGDPNHPMLFSMRGGSPILDIIPGQGASVTNLGITSRTKPGLIRRIGPWGFWDSYRRFIQEFALTVYGPDYFEREEFDEIINGHKDRARVQHKRDLTAAQMQAVAEEYLRLVNSRVPDGIPDDPWDQLDRVAQSVYDSWHWPRVREMREAMGLEHERGSAIIFQAMAHGNFSDEAGPKDSGAGVAQSPQEELGERGLQGSFGFGDEGADIVDGVVTPDKIEVLAQRLPDVARQLAGIEEKLRQLTGSWVELEYTIQNRNLWVLQQRRKPLRGPVRRFAAKALQGQQPVARGIGLAGGAIRTILASEEALDDPDQLKELLNEVKRQGVEGIGAVMDAATPEKTPYLRVEGVKAVLARRGGLGQHIGEIANGLGLVAVAGLGPVDLREGAVVSVDGLTGAVYAGRLRLEPRFDVVSPPPVPSEEPEVISDRLDRTQLLQQAL